MAHVCKGWQTLTSHLMLGLQNLPSEIDQNMHELRRMDDDLQSK